MKVIVLIATPFLAALIAYFWARPSSEFSGEEQMTQVAATFGVFGVALFLELLGLLIYSVLRVFQWLS